LLVVSVKLGALVEARVEAGIYAFAASVVLTMLLSAWIGGHAADLPPRPARQDTNGG
jgi:paraquat-inducible protein A